MMKNWLALLSAFLALPAFASEGFWEDALPLDAVGGGGGASILTTGSDGDSTTIASDSGMELVGGFLTLLRGCGNGQILKWDETVDEWECQPDDNSGGNTAINDIGDATAAGAVVVGTDAEYGQAWTWNTPATTTATLNAMQFIIELDASTDANTQRVISIERAATSGTATLEALLRLINNDTDGAVTSALIIDSAAGGVTNAINLNGANITNAMLTSNATISMAEMEILDAGSRTDEALCTYETTGNQFECDVDTEAELQTQLGAINLIVSTEIDTIGEIETLAAGVNIIISTEIDTTAELETLQGGVNILLETEIDASAELIALMDDETGTGALVFATSPALVTPDLGTPSAITLTNATGCGSACITNDSLVYADVNNDATLAGDPTHGDSSVWFGTTGLIFEGATSNTSEGLFTAADVTADRTWTLPDASGTMMITWDLDGDNNSPQLIGQGNEALFAGGAGVDTAVSATDTLTIVTDSTEENFLANGALTCGAGTRGKIQIHTTPLQYCDNAGTPALQYAAYGDSTGAALTGDSATSFFSAGSLEDARVDGSLESNEIDDDVMPFDDADSNFAATAIGPAIEELDDVNGSGVNAADGKVEWSQLVGVPAGFADGTDATGGGGMTFTLSGDSGSDQTIEDTNTLEVAGGSGITTVAGATDTITIALELEEINSDTFGSGTFTTLTFNAGTTDPQFSFGDGTMTINNVSGGIGMGTTQTECVMLNAAAINCSGTTGCAVTDVVGTNFDYTVAAFDSSIDEDGTWAFELPANFAGTTASWQAVWTSNNAACDGGASADVCWTIDGDSFANDAAFHSGSLAGTLDNETDNCIANGDILYSAASTFTHSMSAGERAVVQVARDIDGGACPGTTADDDLAADALLHAVRFCYEVNDVFSGE